MHCKTPDENLGPCNKKNVSNSVTQLVKPKPWLQVHKEVVGIKCHEMQIKEHMVVCVGGGLFTQTKSMHIKEAEYNAIKIRHVHTNLKLSPVFMLHSRKKKYFWTDHWNLFDGGCIWDLVGNRQGGGRTKLRINAQIRTYFTDRFFLLFFFYSYFINSSPSSVIFKSSNDSTENFLIQKIFNWAWG